jgi:two-component system alkaline phosphatase synthesis response regulator PhoP
MKQQEKTKPTEVRSPAKILVVEDEPNMVAGLRDNFEFEGYEVITAHDGIEGLERALAESPDLVVLDVMMPRMSGLEVCRAATRQTRLYPHHYADRSWTGGR